MSGSLAVVDLGAMVLTSKFGRLSIRAPDKTEHACGRGKKRPKKTIGRNGRQTPVLPCRNAEHRYPPARFQIQFSNSPRSHADVFHRPLVSVRRGAPPSLLPLLP